MFVLAVMHNDLVSAAGTFGPLAVVLN